MCGWVGLFNSIVLYKSCWSRGIRILMYNCLGPKRAQIDARRVSAHVRVQVWS